MNQTISIYDGSLHWFTACTTPCSITYTEAVKILTAAHEKERFQFEPKVPEALVRGSYTLQAINSCIQDFKIYAHLDFTNQWHTLWSSMHHMKLSNQIISLLNARKLTPHISIFVPCSGVQTFRVSMNGTWCPTAASCQCLSHTFQLPSNHSMPRPQMTAVTQ